MLLNRSSTFIDFQLLPSQVLDGQVFLPGFNLVGSISTLVTVGVAAIRVLLVKVPQDGDGRRGRRLAGPAQREVEAPGVDPGLLGNSNSH